MKRLLYAFLMLLLMPVAGAFACTQNEIDVNGDGALCETAKFTITTTEFAAGTTFAFYMSARGTFYVDWGDGTVDTIARTDTDETLYDHTYSTAGVKTIRFGGLATEYSTNVNIAAIRFGYTTVEDDSTPGLVAGLGGSVGQIFPTRWQGVGGQPVFVSSFARTNMRTIPDNLFNGVTGNMAQMFYETFSRCTMLQSIPEKLFNNITGGYHGDFLGTFAYCTSLTSIPETLFANISRAVPYQFDRTFYGCTSLRGYIPPSFFAGLIANNSPYNSIGVGMMFQTFYNTNLDTTCPAGTVQFVTGYEDYWDGHVSCVDENFVCSAGEYLPAHGYECSPCPENNYCVGGTYTYSENTSYGATQCPNSWYSPAGMSSADQCGRILHVGENVVYLRNVKKTTPSLNVRVDGYTFYGNMTTVDVPMNANTTAHMKVQFNNETYSIYDDTVTP